MRSEGKLAIGLSLLHCKSPLRDIKTFSKTKTHLNILPRVPKSKHKNYANYFRKTEASQKFFHELSGFKGFKRYIFGIFFEIRKEFKRTGHNFCGKGVLEEVGGLKRSSPLPSSNHGAGMGISKKIGGG
jgi:hypothetical protein